MEYTPALRKAIRKWKDYLQKEEKYKTLFFTMKKEKWRAEARRLYRQEWDLFAATVRANQKKQQEEQDADVFAVW